MANSFEKNLEMYEDPEGYDELYDHYQEDLAFLLKCAKGIDGPIIELACGTGRLTVPMAKLGYQMIGIDIHKGMLTRAQEKGKEQKVMVDWYQQDCANFYIPFQSSLIYMTGNSFQHFLTNGDQNDLLTSVKKHLLPNGSFIFDTRNPILHELAVEEDHVEHHMTSNNRTIVERNVETYDHRTQILHCTTTTERLEHGAVVDSKRSSISLRYTFPMELKRLLNAHGFELINLYGSWKKHEFGKDSISMVVHCKLQ